MAFQSIEIGTAANDGTGDTLRAGGDKINDNFSEIYTLLGTGTALTSGISATASVVSLSGPTMTGVVSFADGTAGAPSITNTGDANTGIFFSAADQVAISTGGTARVTVSSTAVTSAVNVAIPDAGTIGGATVADAITIASTGIVTFKDDILIKDAGTIGNATTAAAIQIEADGDIVLSDDLYISGGLLDLKNEGSVSQIKLYCESSNAHAQTLQSAPHSLASSAVCVLPTASGTLIGTGDTGTLPLVAIDIDGGTDVGEALVDADLLIVDNGAGGTNRKTEVSRIKTYVADVTLTTAAQGNITSLGTLTTLTVDSIIINGTNIGHTSDTDAMAISSGGVVTFSQVPLFPADTVETADIQDNAVTPAKIAGATNAQTGTSYTFVIGDAFKTVTSSNASAQTITIPPNSSVAFAVGDRIDVVMLGSGTTTVTGGSGVTVNGVSTGSGAISAQYAAVSCLKLATNAWLLMGNHGGVS